MMQRIQRSTRTETLCPCTRLIRSRRLRAVAVVPGHGPASAPWPQALDDEERYLDILVSETRRALAAGTGLAEAVATVGRSERGRWRLFEAYHDRNRSEEHTSELQSLMRISYAVFCLKKKKRDNQATTKNNDRHQHTLNTHSK